MPDKSAAHREQLAEITVRIVEDVIGWIVSLDSHAVANCDDLYKKTLQSMVESLLSPDQTNNPPVRTTEDFDRDTVFKGAAARIGPLHPEQIGELYEQLRGFRLEIHDRGRPTLVPSVRGKRNQGLYYTPPHIVQYIVERTLDALEISDPSEYLDLRILDPAVGTGRFLVETLAQVTERICAGLGRRSDKLQEKIHGLKERLRVRALDSGVDFRPDATAAVRMHVLENCLFGVDIDPVAVTITRATLKARGLPGFPGIPCNVANVRTGNALMGTGKREAHSGAQDQLPMSFGGKLKRLFHWPEEFPEVFREHGGFDAVVGNPPYEILSVKESGIRERAYEQAYFRRFYRTCHGKVNTYRLMLERGLELLRERGALGFIVPATLLADTSADKLRRMILDRFAIRCSLVIPEKAQVFEGVTQALLILVAKEGGPTHLVELILWDGNTPVPDAGVKISLDLIRKTDYRIPVLRTEDDKRLLESLARHPPLGGNGDYAAIATVHQGEINLTTHRRFITSRKTRYPLIRGEHVAPLQVIHPAPRCERLDWVSPAFLEHREEKTKLKRDVPESWKSRPGKGRGAPWEASRIVLGRVVNMGTRRRLKAAAAPAGAFLGDMTNFIARPSLPMPYLLGLLNSRLLNQRIKLTSTNNYISAAEIEALPIPRLVGPVPSEVVSLNAQEDLTTLARGPEMSVAGCTHVLAGWDVLQGHGSGPFQRMIEWVVRELQSDLSHQAAAACNNLWNLLDALVLLLYGVEFYAPVLDGESSKR